MLCAWGVQEWRIYFAEGSSNGITRQFQRYVSVEAMCNRYLLCVSLLQAHSSACMSFMTLATVCVCPSSNGYLDEHANLLIDGGCHRMDVRPDVWGEQTWCCYTVALRVAPIRRIDLVSNSMKRSAVKTNTPPSASHRCRLFVHTPAQKTKGHLLVHIEKVSSTIKSYAVTSAYCLLT